MYYNNNEFEVVRLIWVDDDVYRKMPMFELANGEVLDEAQFNKYYKSSDCEIVII